MQVREVGVIFKGPRHAISEKRIGKMPKISVADTGAGPPAKFSNNLSRSQ